VTLTDREINGARDAGHDRDERGFVALPNAEPVKHFETRLGHAFCATSCSGSLIQATVGSFGASGRRCRNRAGLAA
jgi:hypothetical protein